MKRLAQILPGLLILALPEIAAGQTATLLGDFNTTFDDSVSFNDSSSSPKSFAVLNKRIVFAASEPSSGTELWVSDGTAAGTRILEDICPGVCSSNPQALGVAKGISLWLVQTKLWRSDGTEAGTYALDTPFVFYSGAHMVLLNSALYFGYCSPERGCELWRSDGTEAGTRVVKTLIPSVSLTGSFWLMAAGKRLFLSPPGEEGRLWISDGTAAGTKPGAAFTLPGLLAGTPDGKLFFTKTDAEGDELWVSDGTSARRLTDFEAPQPFEGTEWIKPIGNRVYLVINDVIHGHEIWRSDGTEKGTQRVTDFGFYEPFRDAINRRLAISQLEEVGSRVLFWATDGLSPAGIWTSDGTPESTAPLHEDLHLECEYQARFVAAGGRMFFVARDASHGCELWSTDGTAAGTRLMRDICTDPSGCNGENPLLVRAMGNSVLFLAHDGAAHGRELWLSDGTAAGTRRLTNMPGTARPGGDFGSDQVASGGRFFFTGTDGHGAELWLTENGETRLVADIARREPSSRPRNMVPFGNQLVFIACDGEYRQFRISSGTPDSTAMLPILGQVSCFYSHTDELGVGSITAAGRVFYAYQNQVWSTDGTVTGTVQLTHFTPPKNLYFQRAVLQGKVYFSVWANGTVEVWKSDGTPEGTVVAFTLPGVPEIYSLTAIGNELYFEGSEVGGSEVWRSDGTPAGTYRITDGIRPQTEPWFTRVGASVFFVGLREFSQTELWKTDGTPAGTVRVRGLLGGYELEPRELIEVQGKLYFFALSEGKWNLWRSDGTEIGTVPLYAVEVPSSPLESPDFYLTSFAGRLYFSGGDSVHGFELWTSDGTADGTTIFRDLLPGPESSQPSSLTAAGGRLFFAANDGEHGDELWQTDGTSGGTKLVQDLAPEDVSSYPGQFTGTATHLYFVADDGVSGREVWSLPLAGSGCQPSPRRLCLSGGRFRVEASWKDFQGNVGVGTAVAVTSDTGYFWFFDPANVEVMLKVLDGTGVNGHRWVFYGALSNVEYTLTVTDTQTGLARRYYNPPGQLASVGDTTSFGPLGAFAKAPGKALVAAPSPAVLATESTDPAAATGSCQSTAEQLCLNGQRFAVEIAWKDFQGHTGKGKAVSLTGDTGYFWFFDAANVEVVLKVLDGTSLNGKHWVFYGALSNVEYTITVTDTQTGTKKTYKNVSGRLASVADTGAF